MRRTTKEERKAFLAKAVSETEYRVARAKSGDNLQLVAVSYLLFYSTFELEQLAIACVEVDPTEYMDNESVGQTHTTGNVYTEMLMWENFKTLINVAIGLKNDTNLTGSINRFNKKGYKR